MEKSQNGQHVIVAYIQLDDALPGFGEIGEEQRLEDMDMPREKR